MEAFLSADRALFIFINHIPHVPWLNTFALILSGVGSGGLVWICISVVLFLKEEKRDHWFFLPVILASFTSWVVSDVLLKSAVGRLRPTVDMGAIIVGDGATNFSFPSTHATFSFALAYVLSVAEPRYRYVFFLGAILIALSRIFLGVHYPSDVLMGALLGWGIGHASVFLVRYIRLRATKR